MIYPEGADGTIGTTNRSKNLNGIKNILPNNAGWEEDTRRQTHSFESGRGGLIRPLGPGSVNPNEAEELCGWLSHCSSCW
ncbi:hypothetical protein E2320_016453 [Naja naja]|nr:hypothetical protein E2320_016453 [Naja naja]